jgi:hypothetical protein
MKTAKFRYVEMRTMGESDIVFAEFPYPLDVNLAIAREIVACRMMFTENHPHYVIIDMTNIARVDADARDFMRHPEGGMKNIKAGALLASNPIAAIVANFFVKVPKDFPARFFYSRQDALNWLLAYRATQQGGPVS